MVKSIGDAVMLAGPDPDALLASMTDLVTACLVEPDMPLPRAGPHTGTAVARGNDFFGAGVNVAARVAALAAGAHVLLTVELLTTLRPPGPPVTPLGVTELRNVRQPVESFDLLGVDGPSPGRYPVHAVDPVCRMRVDLDRTVGRLWHAGREWWMCSLRCAAEFARDPDPCH